jgi:CubicO group peptidase (beta-lactamase class C family)
VGADRKVRILKTATRLLEAGVAGQVFPGGATAVAWRDGEGDVLLNAFAGKLSAGGPAVERGTPYDLASVTKPFTAVTALRLAVEGTLALDTRAEDLLTDVRGGVLGGATLEDLLRHRAGLAAWGGLYLDVPHELGSSAARRWVLAEAARRPSELGPGSTVYSDLGYLIAGEMMARAAGDTLDRVVNSRLTVPMQLDEEVFFTGGLSPERRAQVAKKAAPTERCEWRGRLIRGEVHDENCAALGGVAGHAGLFGTARGVARLGRMCLDVLAGRSDFLPRPMIEAALSGSSSPHRLGWEARSETDSAGRRMSPKSFGHLGFTGTSIWCDPQRDLVVVLLTNRVHPSRANEKIKGFRPAFHDGILAAFDGG